MRLIDADALKEHYNVPDAEGVLSYYDTIMQVIDSQPTIEPEVRHGRWIKKENYGASYSVCSECGAMMNLPWYWYCGKCGAHMDAPGPPKEGT